LLRYLFTLLIVIVLISQSFCQEVRFQRLTTEDGLSNGRNWANKCILKDQFGRVWIATIDGLNLWDGYEVKTFRHDPFDTTSITSNFVTSLAQSKNGDIYIGTANKGVVKYDYSREVFEDLDFENMIGDVVPQVNHLMVDSLDNIWLGTAFSGVWRYHVPTDTFINMPLSRDSITNAHTLGSNNSTILFDGSLAIAGFNGIHIYNYEADSFRLYHIPEEEAFSIAQAPNGELWYGGRYFDGIRILDIRDGSIRNFKYDISGNVYGIVRSPDGNMWFSNASQDGNYQSHKYDPISDTVSTYYYNPNKSTSYSPSTFMEAVFDSLDRMWYMTAGMGAGFASIENPYFEKLTDYPVDNILFWVDGNLLLPMGMSVLLYDMNKKSATTFLSTEKELSFRPSLISSEGDFYCKLFQDQQFFKIDRSSNAKSKFNEIYSMCEAILDDNQGRIWTSQQLEYIIKETGQLIRTNELLKKKGSNILLPNSIYYDIEILSDDEIAIASLSEGMFVYNHKDTILTHYNGENFENGKLSSSSLTYIHKGQTDSLVFVATGNNLNIWNRNSDRFSYINASDGLKGKVLSLYEDENLNLWVLTSKGIHHVRDGKVVAYYGKKYGLMGHVDRIDPTMVFDDDGWIYFSTSEGLFRFDPNRLSQISPPNDVRITELYHKRERMNVRANSPLSQSMLYNPDLSFLYNRRDIGFGFVAPFERDSELSYHYRLIGYDTTWVNNKSNREVHFTNLDNGTYTFEVKAKSSEGKWTQTITRQEFEILAPWYKKWWSYLLFSLLVFSVFYGIYRYRIFQITKYERLRTKISSDLHDDVGTLLSSLAMQSDVLGMDAPPEKVSRFEKFSSLSREAMDRMRDTVWAIDSSKDNMVSLVDRMSDYISDMYDDSRMQIKFHHQKSSLKDKIAPDIRQNVYLIFKEAINNAMKYSKGDKIDVTLNLKGKNVLLSVKDNGQVDNIKSSGLGIDNMKMRAKRIKGSLEIKTDDGFEVLLKIS